MNEKSPPIVVLGICLILSPIALEGPNRMSDEHQKTKDFWAGVYGRGAGTYHRVKSFRHCGERLVALAEIQSGATVLDAAMGRGANLFPAAERVGPSGRVIGIDFAEPMVQETAADISRRGLNSAEVHRMDAEHLEFPDAFFDCVTCGFALFFFPRADRALEEFARVLKPRGKLAVTVPPVGQVTEPRSGAAGLFWELFPVYARQSPRLREQRASNAGDPAAARALESRSWPERQAAGAASWPNREELQEALSQAGFIDIHFVTEEAEIVAEDEEEWWTWQWSHMPRSQLEQLEPELLERFKAELFEKLQSVKEPDGIHLWSQAMFAFGVRP
jgi:O-methyltransferase/aklanonic acid methyltransferase